MSDTRTFRVVDEDGDYYEISGDPTDALNAAYRERAHLVALLADRIGLRAEVTFKPEPEETTR